MTVTSREKKPKKTKAPKQKKEKPKSLVAEEETPLLKKEEEIKPSEARLEDRTTESPEEAAPEVPEAPESVEAPEAPVPEEEPEEEEMEIVEEKFYDLNLRRIWNAPREKRTPRAVRFLRDYVARRMKTEEVSISEEANSMLWQRGISKPPRSIRVRVVKDKEGRVIVFPGEGK